MLQLQTLYENRKMHEEVLQITVIWITSWWAEKVGNGEEQTSDTVTMLYNTLV